MTKFLLFSIFIILSLTNCSKGPKVTDIVKGFYDIDRKNNNFKSKKIKILTGDTLYSISERYNLSTKELIKFNKIKPPYILKPGKFIKIPNAKKYKIKRGDTLYRIANCYNIFVKDILDKNVKLNEKKLLIGKILKLPYYAKNECAAKRLSTTDKITLNSRINKKKGPFNWPTKGIVITKFGKQKGGRRNDGINILSAKGNPVRAALNGKVIYRGNELPAWGNLILIKHKNNWTTAYAHLDKFFVVKGETVKTGDIIGSVGSTGNVVKNQLHFQVRKRSKPLDPIKYLINKK